MGCGLGDNGLHKRVWDICQYFPVNISWECQGNLPITDAHQLSCGHMVVSPAGRELVSSQGTFAPRSMADFGEPSGAGGEGGQTAAGWFSFRFPKGVNAVTCPAWVPFQIPL